MFGKKWVGRSRFFFNPNNWNAHIGAVIMLHQHEVCVYKGKRKLKLLIACENFCTFCALIVFILLCKYYFRKYGKKVYSRGCLERVGRVTVNTTYFSPYSFRTFPIIVIWATSWENAICEHPRSLISAFVFRCLDRIIPLLTIAEISTLASFCSWAGRFESYLVANPEDFLVAKLI